LSRLGIDLSIVEIVTPNENLKDSDATRIKNLALLNRAGFFILPVPFARRREIICSLSIIFRTTSSISKLCSLDRAIFACLGSNLLLKDRKVLIQIKKPFTFIFEGLPQTSKVRTSQNGRK